MRGARLASERSLRAAPYSKKLDPRAGRASADPSNSRIEDTRLYVYTRIMSRSPRRSRPRERDGRSPAAINQASSRLGTKLIGGHFSREIAKEFKLLAVELERTSQDLLHEAIADLLAKYHRAR